MYSSVHNFINDEGLLIYVGYDKGLHQNEGLFIVGLVIIILLDYLRILFDKFVSFIYSIAKMLVERSPTQPLQRKTSCRRRAMYPT